MSFFAAHLGILLITLFFAALGMPLAEMLPWSVRPAARAYLTPALGLAAAVLLATPWGWLGSGFGQAGVRIAAWAVFGMALLWVIWRRPQSLKPLPRLLALSAVCALPFTLQLLFCKAYNPFNDAFTYIVQSQWLQHHNMRGLLQPSVDQPALSQVRYTQVTGTRVSAQFVLSLVQAMLGIRWAHQAYPIAVNAAAAAGCLTVAFAAQAGLRSPSRWVPPLAACFCGLSLNGYAFGQLNGFYPQTVGLACGFAALWIWGITLNRGRSCVPVAVAASASLYAYSEFFPLLVIAMTGGAAVALALAEKVRRPVLMVRVAELAGLMLLFSCPELPRATRAIIAQSHAVVGCAAPWSPGEFAMHSAGFRSGVLEREHWLGDSELLSGVLAGLMLAGAAAQAVCRGLPRERIIALSPILTLLAAAALLFVKFRYFTPSPFPGGTGQSWDQFKLAGWSALGVIGLLGSLTNARGGAPKICACLVLCIAVLTAALTALAMARERGDIFARAEGNWQSPMNDVFKLRAEVNRIVPAGAALHLDLGNDSQRLKQFLAYAWMDRPVLADWSDDVYVYNNMDHLPSKAEINAPDWVVTKGAGGTLELRRAADWTVQIGAIDGTFDREELGPDWWRWTAGAAVVHVQSEWRVHPVEPVPMHMKFGLVVRTREPVVIEVVAQNGQVLQTRSSSPGNELSWYDFAEPDAAKLGENWTMRFTARGEPSTLSPSDPRKAVFMIRDLRVFAEKRNLAD